FSTPFIMSLAVLGIGTVLYTTMNKWTGIYSIFPGKLSFNRVYDWLIEKTDTVSEKVTNFYMTGSLRTYMSIILGTIFIVTLIVMYLTNGFVLDNFYIIFSLRTYMSIILVTIFIVTFIVMYLTNGFALDTSDLAPITTLEIVVVCSIIVAAGATVFSNNNVAAILILGIVGYGVAILFVIYRAPDI